jgi:hypothetical protein
MNDEGGKEAKSRRDSIQEKMSFGSAEVECEKVG